MRCDESADEIRIEAGQRFDGKGLDLIVDNRTADLSKATEDSLDNHLITFVNFQLSKAHNFESAGLVLQQEAIGRLTLTISRQLDVHDLACDDDILVVVELGMRQKFRNFYKAGRSSWGSETKLWPWWRANG